MGTTNMINSSLSCQRWDTDTPHSHWFHNASYFPDATMDDVANYCRNPDSGSQGPWCYTIDPSERWLYCDVPWCGGYNLDVVLLNHVVTLQGFFS